MFQNFSRKSFQENLRSRQAGRDGGEWDGGSSQVSPKGKRLEMELSSTSV